MLEAFKSLGKGVYPSEYFFWYLHPEESQPSFAECLLLEVEGKPFGWLLS